MAKKHESKVKARDRRAKRRNHRKRKIKPQKEFAVLEALLKQKAGKRARKQERNKLTALVSEFFEFSTT